MRAAIILALLAIAAPAGADPCKPARGPMRLDFQPTHSVAELATWLAKTTCKPVTVAPSVPQHSLVVTILAPREYSLKQAQKLVVDAIEALDLKVSERNGALHIEASPMSPKDCPDLSAPPEEDLTPAEITAGIKQIDPTTYEVSRALLDKLATAKLRAATLVPALVNGKSIGYKVVHVRAGSALERLGIQTGVTVKAIDGVDPTTVDGAKLYKQLRDRSQVVVKILRGSALAEVTYKLVK